jgi:hypothetical protein
MLDMPEGDLAVGQSVAGQSDDLELLGVSSARASGSPVALVASIAAIAATR